MNGAQRWTPILIYDIMDLGNFKIFRKEGWKLNENDKVVNGIMKGLCRNDGHCPCARLIGKKIAVAARYM